MHLVKHYGFVWLVFAHRRRIDKRLVQFNRRMWVNRGPSTIFGVRPDVVLIEVPADIHRSWSIPLIVLRVVL
jgi:hypothetical protein